MSEQETCPKCGAAKRLVQWSGRTEYRCGTIVFVNGTVSDGPECMTAQLAASERARRIAERALWLCCQDEVERQIAVNGSCALTVEETRGMWCKAAAMVEASDE
jgi:ssDNA-binding Zn-finger/Zn-ribbon topoisomerase 1